MANNQPQNTLNLTSFYLSANYRVSWKLSLSGSYDNRKNVIYYETFRNYADEILQQASRQGVRLRINYRPLNYLMFGASGGTRFRKEDPRPSNSINGYATWSRVPLINASLNVSANVMQTSYLAGQIYGARVSKDIIPGKIYSTLQYRRVDFNYVNSATILKQNIGEVDFSYQINKKLYLTVNFEATIQENDWFNRLYLNLRIKF
jgi:predicted porin